eukprot:CAMPEP_0116826830 /NCGR_PEP_ID=MMETSP0418-20121206/2746_1 /TAXON_ID=1158023 /ORGANISM="Astrosyne radiata, Strain 13vi08-1A" /LENGTH=407 /DNA_ID=CAMNT_0004455507 /DNA_START=29 /DNA_END=1252 /DNA_ORIENTATION=+
MRLHKENLGVKQRATELLWSLSQYHGNRFPISQAGVADWALESLQRNEVSDCSIQAGALGILRNLAHVNSQGIVDANGIRIIVRAMRQGVRDADLTRHGCNALSVVAVNESYQERIIGARGIEVVIDGMNTHKRDSFVQCAGLNVLETMSTNSKCKDRIRESGGMTVLLGAMINHGPDIFVQQKGCALILDLVDSDSVVDSRDMRHKIRASVLGAMRNHKHDGKIQNHGCAIVSILAEWGQSQSITTAGGIDDIFSAMAIHDRNKNVQKRAIGALHQLASQSLHAKKKILENSGIKRICSTVRKYSSDSELQCSGWQGLKYLFNDEDVDVTPDILATFRATIADNGKDDSVVVEVMGAMIQLATSPENKAKLRDGEVDITFASVMKSLGSDHPSLRHLHTSFVNRTR